MQSLGALAHFDYNQPAAYSYEQAFQILKRLNLPMAATEELYRRMLFNIVARNQDDHVKNIAFLMNKQGEWSLSPAYDMTFAYDQTNKWLAKHQMSLNGKRDGFVLADLEKCAQTISLKRSLVKTILSDVQNAVTQWNRIAAECGVPRARQDQIKQTFRNLQEK